MLNLRFLVVKVDVEIKMFVDSSVLFSVDFSVVGVTITFEVVVKRWLDVENLFVVVIGFEVVFFLSSSSPEFLSHVIPNIHVSFLQRSSITVLLQSTT